MSRDSFRILHCAGCSVCGLLFLLAFLGLIEFGQMGFWKAGLVLVGIFIASSLASLMPNEKSGKTPVEQLFPMFQYKGEHDTDTTEVQSTVEE